MLTRDSGLKQWYCLYVSEIHISISVSVNAHMCVYYAQKFHLAP